MKTVDEILLEQHERRMQALQGLPDEAPGPTARISNARRALIHDLYLKGLSYRKIAAQVGVSTSTITLVLRVS